MQKHNTATTQRPATVEVDALQLMECENGLYGVQSMIRVLEMAAEGLRNGVGISNLDAFAFVLDQVEDRVGSVKCDVCAMRGGEDA